MSRGEVLFLIFFNGCWYPSPSFSRSNYLVIFHYINPLGCHLGNHSGGVIPICLADSKIACIKKVNEISESLNESEIPHWLPSIIIK